MAAKRRARKSRPNESTREPLTFLAPEPPSFAYIDLDDEFEIPPVPERYALTEAKVAFQLKQQVERW